MTTVDVAEHFDDSRQQARAAILGMWVFLVTELLLFGGLLAAFALTRVEHAGVFAEAATHLSLVLGTINTAILLTSGLTMALCERALGENRRTLALVLLAATVFLGTMFLALKGYEWHHEYQQSLLPVLNLPFRYPGDNPDVAELFFNFYAITTGLHVVHMLIGLGLLAVMGTSIFRGRHPETAKRRLPIVGLYWAFVDVVWIVIFSLMYLQRA